MSFSENRTFTISVTAIGAFFVGAGISVEAENVSQLSDQVIHKVESLVNDAANEAAGTFGDGNTEISIRNLGHNPPDWSIITTQPLTKLGEDKSALFWQGSLGSYDQNGDRRTTLNLGLGKRWLLDSDLSIAGLNSFVDYEGKSNHTRASLGAEYRRSNFELHANHYWGLSSTKTVDGTDEDALDGYDLMVRGQMPYLPWANLVGKEYRWDRSNQDDVKGNYYGLEMHLTPGLKLEWGQQDDNYMVESNYGKLTYVYPPKQKQVTLLDRVVDEIAWRDGADMKDKMLDKVERSNKIVIEFGGITVSRTD